MKKKRLLFVLLISAMICLSIIACAKPPQELSEGPETGEYFYDAETDEYRITLNSGNKFTLLLETTKSGEYTLEDGVLTLVPNKLKDIEQEPAITATYSDRVIIYKNMRFVERIIYTVSFNSNGGTDVDPIPVLNGRTISKPRLDPTRGTSVFYGWYTDNTLSTPFMFGTPVTADIELFAKWVEPIPGQNEFLIGFDLNYPDAPAVTSAKTIGGKLHSAPEPIRDGYVFKGWWVSMYENKNMLSYPLVTTAEADLPSVSYLSTVFEESTTLYALWLTAATANSTPIVRINETGIEWSGILGVGTYRVDITGPNGFSEGASVGLATYNFAFSDRAAGDYIITVGAGSIITTIYYRNKALARVSLFNVVEPSLLIYNPVKNATKYLVYIKCGDILHNHDPFNNGTSTYYNFANCSMREGGIEFTVRAEANGFAPSVSKKFIHSRDLSQIVRWSFDSANQILSWDAVPNATNYIVGIDDGKPHQFDNGGKTSVSLKEYARGDMMVKVTPATKGWNSPLPSQYPYTKTNLSTPLITGISGQFVEWTPVTGATVYDIKIGNDNPVELTEDYELPANLNDVISIRARGTGVTDSLWSDPIAVGVSMTGLSYYQNIVSWNYVTGATAYEVWLNDEYLCEAEGVNFAVISLAKPGANKIEVRADVNSSLASIEVFAHTLSFD
ncbi:MAG: InlB B-repeat-containing protein, partial [Firmicutes bacterium]|nr:InlB B-repeat-containing protein [Bacillota bacterium]